eukprot:10379371-Karenia_brevis.AAC.1
MSLVDRIFKKRRKSLYKKRMKPRWPEGFQDVHYRKLHTLLIKTLSDELRNGPHSTKTTKIAKQSLAQVANNGIRVPERRRKTTPSDPNRHIIKGSAKLL